MIKSATGLVDSGFFVEESLSRGLIDNRLIEDWAETKDRNGSLRRLSYETMRRVSRLNSGSWYLDGFSR